MIIKVCQFQAKRETGERLVQVFQPGQIEEAERFFSAGGMRKEAAPLLPDVRSYLERLKPDSRKIYTLVNALGAGEYWGSNINGDWFGEDSLIHEGQDYGYRTFYNAHCFKHHANKQPEISFGDIELSVWHPGMKRVELVIAVDRDRAQRFGAQDVVDKLDKGIFPDVSMGTKVPFDRCSICCDIKKFERAKASFDPSLHQTIGQAILMWHRRDPIRGVSVTRNDYCEHLRDALNKILEDGRRVCAINDYPRFFDLSFVFIGADKTAKVMAKLAMVQVPSSYYVLPSWRVAELAGYQQPDTDKDFELEKAASVLAPRDADKLVRMADSKLKASGVRGGIDSVVAKLREKRASHQKGATIIKDVVPHFGGKAVPAKLPESDLPDNILDALGSSPLSSALSTPSHMGMLLKPHEFQKIIIIRMGKKPDEDLQGASGFGAGDFSSKLMQILLPFLEGRSNFEPVVKRRIVRIQMGESGAGEKESEPLGKDKISAAYSSYLDQALQCAFSAEGVVNGHPDLWCKINGSSPEELFSKTAGTSAVALLGALGATYLLSAYGRHKEQQAVYGKGEPPGMVLQFLADHPHMAAIAVGLGVAHLQGSDLPRQLVEKGKKVVKTGVEVLRRS